MVNVLPADQDPAITPQLDRAAVEQATRELAQAKELLQELAAGKTVLDLAAGEFEARLPLFKQLDLIQPQIDQIKEAAEHARTVIGELQQYEQALQELAALAPVLPTIRTLVSFFDRLEIKLR